MKKISVLFIIFALVSCATKVKKVQKPTLNPDNYNVAFLIIDGVFNTELTAPYDVFHHTIFRENIKAMNVFTVSNTTGPIKTFEGLSILPDYNFLTDKVPDIDILVVPSAAHNLDTDLENTDLLNFVHQVSKNTLYTTSHCDGAFVLAKSGILNGIESTTFPEDIEPYKKMFPTLTVHDSVYFVHDGKFITSSGGATSFDAALYLCQVLYGKKVTTEIAEGLVINWNLDNIPHIVIKQPKN